MIDDALTRAWTSGDVRHAYTSRDAILYALGLGLGQDPLDPQQLRHTYEQGLVALPSMAAVLASPGFCVRVAAGLIFFFHALREIRRIG